MTAPDGPELPSLRQLWRATAIAALVAAVLLVTIVLPAEYGVDPTGAGAKIGLLRLAEAEPGSQPSRLPAGQAELVSRQAAPFRTDTMMLTLASGEGREIKATMRQSERFVFSWVTDGDVVDFEMHGEAVNANPDDYTSYWKDEDRPGAHGSFEAPFNGRHGWFWQNLGPDPVTITLTTSGFYEELALLAPTELGH
jgi:hypothetical protein